MSSEAEPISKAEQNIVRIRTQDYDGIRNLWTQVRDGTAEEWKPGRALEHLILRAFQLEGAEVIWPYDVTERGEVIEQIDGVVYYEGLSCLIEAKDVQDRINVEPIAKLRNQLLRRPASAIGSVFSKSGFTDPAKILAQYMLPQTILLWSDVDITQALNQERMGQGMKLKYRYAVERGLVEFNLTNEVLR